MKKLLTALLVALTVSMAVSAQDYRYEIGPAIGVSGYLGDVNNANMWKHAGLAGGVVFRHNINSRWAVKGDLLYASIQGNSQDISNKFPGGENYDFKSNLIDLGAQVEFNFLHFGTGAKYKNYKRLSPYMVLGLGFTLADCNGTHFSMNLPMGFGIKYKLKERLNLGFEFTMRACTGDKIDGLSDLNGQKHGIWKNCDWYSVTMLTLTYEFSKRCKKCHYVE